MVKNTQTIRRLLPANYLSVFDHFVGLALKGLNLSSNFFPLSSEAVTSVIFRTQFFSCYMQNELRNG